jgi:LacI family transcriptional regulator
VSVATVSKVLNGRSDVAPATRALVQDLLHEHRYVARRIRPTPSPMIELFFHGQLNAYHTEVLQGVVEAAAEAGVAAVVSVRPRGQRGSGANRPAAWARELATAGRQAAIVVTSELAAADLTALSRARTPVVVIDPLNLPSAQVTSVGSTNFAGGLAATQHLLDLGHRRIAYLGGPAAAGCNQARMHGFRGAMEAAGVPVPDGFVRTGRFSYEHGIAGGAALLDLPRPPTAVFAGSDETALGVIEAARNRGLRIPEDLSVVGFDDTRVARLAAPPLTTVRQPLREMGAVAVRTALRLAAGERVDSHHVELATELVVRQSTARPLASAAAAPPPKAR